MAVPVFFTAELLPFQNVAGNAVDEAATLLATELKDFFTDKADFVINTDGTAGVGTTYDTSAADPSLSVVISTLVGGFRGISEDEALSLAQTFTSERFPQVQASLDQGSIASHPVDKPAEPAADSTANPAT